MLAIAGVAAVAVALLAVPLAIVLQRNYFDEDLLRLQRDTVADTRQIDLRASGSDPVELPRGTRSALGAYDRAGRRVAGVGPIAADTVVHLSRSLDQGLRLRAPGSVGPRASLVNRRAVPGLDEPARLLATPVERRGGRVVLLVGATRENRAEALRSLRTKLLLAGPIALLLATGFGYLLAGTGLRAVDAMRRRAADISADRPGERLPVSSSTASATASRGARPTRGGRSRSTRRLD